jgi:hypothetical protein
MSEAIVKAAESVPNWRDAALRGLLEQKCAKEMASAIADLENKSLSPSDAPNDKEPSDLEDDKPHWYAMIDAGQFFYTDIALEPLLSEAGLTKTLLLSDTESEDVADLGGWLVPLPEAGAQRDRAIKALAPLMAYGWTLSFFQTRAEPSLLLSHLRRYVHAMLEEGEGEKKVLFATFDPRVIHMLNTHRKDIASTLALPTSAWFYWDDQLKLQRLEGADNHRPKVAVQSILSFSKEDVAHFDNVLQTGFIQANLIERFAESERDVLELLPPHLRYRLIGELLERAKKLHIDTLEDRFVFCSIGLFKHLKPDTVVGLQEGQKEKDKEQAWSRLRMMSTWNNEMWSDELKAQSADLIQKRLIAFSEDLKSAQK